MYWKLFVLNYFERTTTNGIISVCLSVSQAVSQAVSQSVSQSWTTLEGLAYRLWSRNKVKNLIFIGGVFKDLIHK